MIGGRDLSRDQILHFSGGLTALHSTVAGYLKLLTLRIAAGLESLGSDDRDKQSVFFLDAQRDDGGFAGREGESDLYYTGFGVRGLSLLGGLHEEPARRAAEFLPQAPPSAGPGRSPADAVHGTVLPVGSHRFAQTGSPPSGGLSFFTPENFISHCFL